MAAAAAAKDSKNIVGVIGENLGILSERQVAALAGDEVVAVRAKKLREK